MLLMLGANLTSVQKLLGHSDPKITERRYGHLLPEFMSAEVNRLRFGLDRLAPARSASQAFAAPRSSAVTLGLQSEGCHERGRSLPDFSERFRPGRWRGVRDSNPWPPA